MAKKLLMKRFITSGEEVEEERFLIDSETGKNMQKFNLRRRETKFSIKPVPSYIDPITWIKGALHDIVKYITKEVSPSDKIGMTFCGESFEHRGPAWINFQTAGGLMFQHIWDVISKVFQSNSEGLSTDKFCLTATYISLPYGKGRKKQFYNFAEECKQRRGIITIKNKDNLCLPRALVACIAKIDKEVNFRHILHDVGKIQAIKAKELIQKAGVIIPQQGCGIHELTKFQNYLTNYKIVVYQYNTRGRIVIFEGNTTKDVKNLNLLYHENHFNVIGSLTAAFCTDYYCESCHVPFWHKNEHRCSKTCPCCRNSTQCPKNGTNVKCNICNRTFRGEKCFDFHRASSCNSKSICDTVKKCLNCLHVYKTERQHFCNEYFCKICHQHVPSDHLCFIQQDKKQKNFKNCIYVFYDLETRQEKNIDTQLRQHIPNLCVLQQRCDNCIDDESLVFCQKCKFRQIIFEENHVIEKMMNHILKLSAEFREIIVVAHNGQAFDHQFILNYVLNKTNVEPKLIMRGTKIILMMINNVKFIDSLNFFPMALAKLPKAFNLSTKLKKGFFPHLFNKLENENYIGSLPPMKYFTPDSMKEDERNEFHKWYTENKNCEFNMRKEIVEYCSNDVKILTEACLSFRRIFLQECNIEPFLEAATIASACNLVFRRNFLCLNTIGIIPRHGYRLVDNQSEIALQWLVWEQDTRKIKFQYAANGREKVIGGVKVDAFCDSTKEVFEFQGCFYHGHPKCLIHKRDVSLYNDSNDTLNQRYERTLAKNEYLKSLGYKVIEMWECAFREQMKTNKNMFYLKNHPIIFTAPLNPRDAFYGGRTGNVYTHYKCKNGEKIKYIDVCSMYPGVCKYGKFPVKHPKVHVGNSVCSGIDLQKTNGLIKCKILPPENLFHPVLPQKQNNKLMFSLCQSCGDQKNQSAFCLHSNDERALTGTWVIDEVLQALKKNYKILHIYEIWEYEITQYNKEKKEQGLFTEMMNKFIKIKQESSGFPSKYQTELEKQKYIDSFLSSEEVQLEFKNINNNPGLRSFAKLILNSFWGKFGQRENQQQTTIVNQPFVLNDLLTNPSIEVCQILPINEEVIIVSWQYKEEAVNSLSTINVCIAAYTTAQARLHLYSYLEKIGHRVLYYDTDSIIYISQEGEYDPPLGERIGDMTDELECYGLGSYISEFVSGGPKNYAFKVFSTKDNSEKLVCKVKGINLNHTTSKLINFETIKHAVLHPQDWENIAVVSQNIKRTKDHEVHTVTETKRYQPKSEKRRFLKDHSSVPFGYKRPKFV